MTREEAWRLTNGTPGNLTLISQLELLGLIKFNEVDKRKWNAVDEALHLVRKYECKTDQFISRLESNGYKIVKL